MLSVKKPNEDAISDILFNEKDKQLNYSFIKGTLEHRTKEEFEKDERFKSYDLDHYRILLGKGEVIYRRSVEALRGWKHLETEWVDVCYPVPIVVGADVAIIAKAIGIWTVSVCRVIYVIEDEMVPFKRFGFGYGTLPMHVTKGEGRFMVEWNTQTDEVFYDYFSFSQPESWYTKIAYPVARYIQDGFAQDSIEAMKYWVKFEKSKANKSDITVV